MARKDYGSVEMRIFVDYYERKENNHEPGTAAHMLRALDIGFSGEYKITRYPQPKGDLEPTNLIADWELDWTIFKLKHRVWINQHELWKKFLRQ